MIKDLSVGGFIELVSVISAYNFCSRMINALLISPEGEL